MDWDRLALLHDAIVRRLAFESSENAARRLSIQLECPSDLGDAEWNGQTLDLTADGIWFLGMRAHGCCSGSDTLDSINQGVSPETLAVLERGEAAGLKYPTCRLSVAFHSGSEIELVCERLTIFPRR